MTSVKKMRPWWGICLPLQDNWPQQEGIADNGYRLLINCGPHGGPGSVSPAYAPAGRPTPGSNDFQGLKGGIPNCHDRQVQSRPPVRNEYLPSTGNTPPGNGETRWIPDNRGGGYRGREIASSNTTDWAAIPSSRPVKPRRSVVVALTLTHSTGSFRSEAMFFSHPENVRSHFWPFCDDGGIQVDNDPAGGFQQKNHLFEQNPACPCF